MDSNQIILPSAILISSFLGSWHCAGMCGPFAALNGSRDQLWQYHLGRGAIYIGLGSAAGAFGQTVFGSSLKTIQDLSALGLSMVLIFIGVQYLRQANAVLQFHSSSGKIFSWLYRKVHRSPWAKSGWAMGMLAGFLPCMWLYTYVLAAAASKSAAGGAVVMTLFWLGGLPALSAVSLMIRAPVKSAGPQKQKIAGMVLVCAGIYALISHVFLNGH